MFLLRDFAPSTLLDFLAPIPLSDFHAGQDPVIDSRILLVSMHAPHRYHQMDLPVTLTVLLTPAVSSHPEESDSCICTFLHYQCWLRQLRKLGHS